MGIVTFFVLFMWSMAGAILEECICRGKDEHLMEGLKDWRSVVYYTVMLGPFFIVGAVLYITIVPLFNKFRCWARGH